MPSNLKWFFFCRYAVLHYPMTHWLKWDADSHKYHQILLDMEIRRRLTFSHKQLKWARYVFNLIHRVLIGLILASNIVLYYAAQNNRLCFEFGTTQGVLLKTTCTASSGLYASWHSDGSLVTSVTHSHYLMKCSIGQLWYDCCNVFWEILACYLFS